MQTQGVRRMKRILHEAGRRANVPYDGKRPMTMQRIAKKQGNEIRGRGATLIWVGRIQIIACGVLIQRLAWRQMHACSSMTHWVSMIALEWQLTVTERETDFKVWQLSRNWCLGIVEESDLITGKCNFWRNCMWLLKADLFLHYWKLNAIEKSRLRLKSAMGGIGPAPSCL